MGKSVDTFVVGKPSIQPRAKGSHFALWDDLR